MSEKSRNHTKVTELVKRQTRIPTALCVTLELMQMPPPPPHQHLSKARTMRKGSEQKVEVKTNVLTRKLMFLVTNFLPLFVNYPDQGSLKKLFTKG